MSITAFLNNNGFQFLEGNCQGCIQQVLDLAHLTNKPNIKVMEIGFNAGHSAEVFLHVNRELTLTSFDLGEHAYVRFAKKYIDTTVILDDTVFLPEWEAFYTTGPTRTWIEHVEQNKIVELARKNYAPGRGMSWGKYTM